MSEYSENVSSSLVFPVSYRNVELRHQVVVCGGISRGVGHRNAVAPILGYLIDYVSTVNERSWGIHSY